jgi:hypothetical protein
VQRSRARQIDWLRAMSGMRNSCAGEAKYRCPGIGSFQAQPGQLDMAHGLGKRELMTPFGPELAGNSAFRYSVTLGCAGAYNRSTEKGRELITFSAEWRHGRSLRARQGDRLRQITFLAGRTCFPCDVWSACFRSFGQAYLTQIC